MDIDERRAGLRNLFLDLLRFGCCCTNKLWHDITDCKLFDIVHSVEDIQHPFLPNIANSTCESAQITAVHSRPNPKDNKTGFDKVANKTGLLDSTLVVSSNLIVITFVLLVNSLPRRQHFPSNPSRDLFEVNKNSRTAKSRRQHQPPRRTPQRDPKFYAAAHTHTWQYVSKCCEQGPSKHSRRALRLWHGLHQFCLCLCPLPSSSLVLRIYFPSSARVFRSKTSSWSSFD